MIEYINIKGNAFFEDCSLHELGKINVLCGKNNSGKSTTLSYIQNEQQTAVFGKRLNWDDFKTLYGIGNGSSVNPFNDKYLHDALKSIFESRDVWFEDDSETLKELVTPYFSHWVATNNFQGKLSSPKIDTLINKNFSKVLIPPRRTIQPSVTINASEKVNATGTGIINHLFLSKNTHSSIFRKSYDELYQAFYEVSGGYEIILEQNTSNAIELLFSNQGAEPVSSRVSGLGLHNLLVLLYYSIYPAYDILLIEEPETHLHAAAQKRLLTYWRENTAKQYFLTTHNNVFLNPNFVDRIFFTKYSNSKISVSDATNRAEIFHDLGYDISDNLISDLTILVEGPTDVPVFEELFKKLDLNGKYNINILPLGGDIMNQIDLSVFVTHHNVMAIIDKDDKDSGTRKIREKFVKNCEENSIPVHRLKRYSIENYFSVRALKEIFKAQIDASITEIKPDIKLFDQLKIDVKKNNRKIAKELTIEEIANTDLQEFLDKVAETCKNTQRELTEDS